MGCGGGLCEGLDGGVGRAGGRELACGEGLCEGLEGGVGRAGAAGLGGGGLFT